MRGTILRWCGSVVIWMGGNSGGELWGGVAGDVSDNNDFRGGTLFSILLNLQELKLATQKASPHWDSFTADTAFRPDLLPSARSPPGLPRDGHPLDI